MDFFVHLKKNHAQLFFAYPIRVCQKTILLNLAKNLSFFQPSSSRKRSIFFSTAAL